MGTFQTAHWHKNEVLYTALSHIKILNRDTMKHIGRESSDHLEKVGESYAQHLKFAFPFGFQLIKAGLAVFIHALIPALLDDYGSRTVHRLHDELEKRVKDRS